MCREDSGLAPNASTFNRGKSWHSCSCRLGEEGQTQAVNGTLTCELTPGLKEESLSVCGWFCISVHRSTLPGLLKA